MMGSAPFRTIFVTEEIVAKINALFIGNEQGQGREHS
jgi:hypothetical protein